ncbi:MAG: OmpA family protein [Bacteroidia bacterium]|nr:OmpA family protein [Bacteroidia bacterium]
MKTTQYTLLLTFLVLFLFHKLNAQTDNDLKPYSNFDFIAGEQILFEDDFKDSPNGEFPPRWNLLGGQATVNRLKDDVSMVCIEGSLGTICEVEPAMKKNTKNYLKNAFTVEFDFFYKDNDGYIMLSLRDNTGDVRSISFESTGEIKTNYFDNPFVGIYKGDVDNYTGKWHHVSVAYKNQQIKLYIDQYRVLVIPKCGFDPASISFGLVENTRIKNVKVAEGGGMNMLGKILTDGKFVTHAIKFDVSKATIKGESMGFLNELAKWLKENTTIKLEIGGHTDSDGDDTSNLKLSQQRAEAVKKVLVSLGVEDSRLSPKGYGETKPLSSNNTPEGKADNRRVEFLKI